MPFNFNQIQQKFPDALQLTVTFKRGANPPTDDQLCSFLGGGKVLYSKDFSGNKKKIVVSKLAAAKVLVIYGPQGSGKTTLARRYAELFADNAVYYVYNDILHIYENPKLIVIDNWPACVNLSRALQCVGEKGLIDPDHVIVCVQTRPEYVFAPREGFFFIRKQIGNEKFMD
jgi:hypothetical protein